MLVEFKTLLKVLSLFLVALTQSSIAQNVDLASLPSSEGAVFLGGTPNSVNREIVAGVKDFNGDGLDDFLVGASQTSVGSFNGCGRGYLVYGKSQNPGTTITYSTFDTDNSQGFHITRNRSNYYLGDCVADAGDFNNDGLNDVIISAIGSERTAIVIFGRTNSPNINLDTFTASDTNGFKITNSSTTASLSGKVAGAGDLNGDGFDDILITSYFSQSQVAVIFGKSNGISNIDLANFTTSDQSGFCVVANGGGFGYNLSSAGDFNNDGFNDFVVGRDFSAYLVLGKPSGFQNIDMSVAPLPDNIVSIDLTNALSPSALKYVGGGDFNKDGFSDLVFVSKNGRTGNASGRGAAYVLYGRANISNSISMSEANTAGNAGFHIDGPAGSYIGDLCCFPGDVNNDGFDDVMIASPAATPYGRDQSGSSFVIYGQSNRTQHIDLAAYFPPSAGFRIDSRKLATLPPYMSTANDFNGDGYDDMLISQLNQGIGTTYLTFGRPAAAVIEDWSLWQ